MLLNCSEKNLQPALTAASLLSPLPPPPLLGVFSCLFVSVVYTTGIWLPADRTTPAIPLPVLIHNPNVQVPPCVIPHYHLLIRFSKNVFIL